MAPSAGDTERTAEGKKEPNPLIPLFLAEMNRKASQSDQTPFEVDNNNNTIDPPVPSLASEPASKGEEDIAMFSSLSTDKNGKIEVPEFLPCLKLLPTLKTNAKWNNTGNSSIPRPSMMQKSLS